MEVLYEGPFFRFMIDRAKSAAWLVRSPRSSREPDANPDVEFGNLERALSGLVVSSMKLVVDLRQALGRNDPAFESQVMPLFFSVVRRFQKVGALVATAAGKLQVVRLGRERGFAFEAFTEEAEARRFLGL